MRLYMGATTFLLLMCGCTNTQLRVSTLNQASTLSDLQYNQVLNNLAMFALNPNALPWHVSIANGATQIADTGSLGTEIIIGKTGTDAASLIGTPRFDASRGIVGQWGTVPVTDSGNLKLLQMAYQSAFGCRRILDVEAANSLARGISTQIGTTADISVDQDTLRSIINIHSNRLAKEYEALDGDSPASNSSTMKSRDAQYKLASMKTQQPESRSTPPASTDVDLPPALDPSDGFTEPIENDRNDRSLPFRQSLTNLIDLYGQVTDDISDTLDYQILAIDPTDPSGTRFVPFIVSETSQRRVATGLAKATISRVNDIQSTLISIPTGWFHVGKSKHDVPKNACYVGQYKFGGQICYAWVCADGLKELSDFTMSVMDLSGTYRDSQLLSIPTGIQFAPALVRP